MIDLGTPELASKLSGLPSAAPRGPRTYAEAKAWLTSLGGFHVVTEHAEEVLVAVAVRGRGAEAVAASRSDFDVADALFRAIRTLVTRL
ncbi:MAG TPA: hypothetical protein VGI39_28960 [Polyangiaceae bacterium]|jgi:hypothetical protein